MKTLFSRAVVFNRGSASLVQGFLQKLHKMYKAIELLHRISSSQWKDSLGSAPAKSLKTTVADQPQNGKLFH